MKKTLLNLLAIILAVSMVFTMAPLSMDYAYADDIITVNGSLYTLNDDGTTVTVSAYAVQSGDVTIPSSVSHDGKEYTVTGIGNYAFYYCSGLESITLPEGVTSIGESAFEGCTNLTTITIPVSVTFIDTNAFNNAPLTTVNFGGERYQWAKITGEGKPSDDIVHCVPTIFTIEGVEYTLNDDGTTVTVSGWDETIQSTVGIPQRVRYGDEEYTVTSIGDYAFNNCEGLRTITLPESLTSIGENAFEGCTNLTAITIPEKVTSLGEYAFRNCSNLTTITIPVSVTYIGEYAFDHAPLTTVTFGGTKSQWDAITGGGKPENATVNYTMMIDGVAYLQNNDDGTAVVTGWDETIQSRVEIPQSVKYEEENYTVTSIGQNAFKGCNSIQYVILSNGVTSIGDFAFANSDTLETIKFPNSLKSIGVSAFTHCEKIDSITLPDGLESIGHYAFRWSGLESIIIPASVTSIGGEAFLGSSALTSVEFAEGSAITTIPNGLFYGCGKLEPIEIPEGVKSIERSAFYHCYSMTTITIPESVTSIRNEAFQSVPLTAVNFGGSKAQWDAITGEGKPTGVTVNFAKEDPFKPISISGAGVALSAKSFTYNGKAQKPAIVKIGSWKMAEGTDYTAAWSNASSKNVGTYSVAVTGKGNYKDTAKAAYQIVPKGTTLKKPKKAKKAVTVKWKKQKAKMPKARISGYQIQLATNSAFTASTKTLKVKGYKKTSKKVKKLKGKTKYYVRVRTYMKSGGKTYYSPWSKVKTVKTK